MNTAMTKTLSALFLVAVFLMLIMSSCMSKEEKALDNIISNEKATMPYDVISDVKAIDVTYSTSDKLVTYTYEVEPGIMAKTLSSTTGLVKQGLLINYKTNSDYEEFVNALIAAQANIKYNLISGDENIGSIEIAFTELQ